MRVMRLLLWRRQLGQHSRVPDRLSNPLEQLGCMGCILLTLALLARQLQTEIETVFEIRVLRSAFSRV